MSLADDFDRIARIVADYYLSEDVDPEWRDVYDLAGPFACGWVQGHITGLSDRGRRLVVEAYEALLEDHMLAAGSRFENLTELLSASRTP